MPANFAHGEYVSKPVVRYLHGTTGFRPCYQSRMKTLIKELRVRKGMTQDRLADMVGMSKSYLSEIERGVKEVNGRRLEAFAKALGVETHELIATASRSTGEADAMHEHLQLMRSLSQEDQEAIIRMARALSRKTP